MAAGKSETKTRIASSGRRMQQETVARKVIYTEKRTGLPNTLAAITPTDILSCRRGVAHCARKTITRVSGKKLFRLLMENKKHQFGKKSSLVNRYVVYAL